MSNNPKVSVIVPVYNVEKYLPVCLDSLAQQTLDDIEIIIVNDGTPDNSQIIIDDYVQRYPSRMVSYIKENGGLSDARNFGIARANGEYIGFVDSDDCVREDMFDLLYEEATKKHADLTVCDYYTFDNEIKEHYVKKLYKTSDSLDDYFDISVLDNPELLLNCRSYAWNKLYRREWWNENGFLFPVGQWFEDSAIIYNTMLAANKISYVSEPLYYYRQNNENSITHRVDPRMYDAFKSCDSILAAYRPYLASSPELKEVVFRVIQKHLMARLTVAVEQKDNAFTIDFYNSMVNYLNKNDPGWRKNEYLKKVEKRNLYYKLRNHSFLMNLYIRLPLAVRDTLNGETWTNYRRVANYISNDRLKELQSIELDILKDIDRVCKENDITYYLGEGSLLGAIRHNGFIPWDDDLDIVMPRADYNKFLKIASNKLSPSVFLLNENSYPDYYLPFSKVVSLDNHGFINMLDRFDEKYNGPFVDIFPVDYYDKKDKPLEEKYKNIRKWRDMLLFKADYMFARTAKKKLTKLESHFVSNKALYKKLNREMICKVDDPKYMCNFASSYHPSRQLVKKEVYGEPKYVLFEDFMAPVPNEYDKLLRKIYGQYRRMPLIKDRVCRHSFYDEESTIRMSETKTAEDNIRWNTHVNEIQTIRKYEKVILDEVDRICNNNGLQYYLFEGTLWGAVNGGEYYYRGNSIKIALFRKDFDSFIKKCDEDLGSDYKLLYHTTVDNYWQIVPRICLVEKTGFEERGTRAYTQYTGPYVSIYPLDDSPEDIEKALEQKELIEEIKTVIKLKATKKKRKSQMREQKALLNKYQYFSISELHNMIYEIATQYNSTDCSFVNSLLIRKSIENEHFSKQLFGSTRKALLDGSYYPVPEQAEEVLLTIFDERIYNNNKVTHTFYRRKEKDS